MEEKRSPLPAKPGQAECYDYKYRRNGVRNRFICGEAGGRSP